MKTLYTDVYGLELMKIGRKIVAFEQPYGEHTNEITVDDYYFAGEENGVTAYFVIE
jgi:hypothetical protein